MTLPDFDDYGVLPPGIVPATLQDTIERYGQSSDVRKRQADLLRHVVTLAVNYPTITRILVWGSFVTAKAEPNDLDYSIVVSVEHRRVEVAEAHRRFFVPALARQFYGTDTGYLLIRDFPVERYAEQIDFLCHNRQGECGIIEISIWGEYRRGEQR
jgi:hypothetical protein